MTEAAEFVRERRRVTPELLDLGLAGLALLRMHATREPGDAEACVAAIRQMLKSIESDSHELSTPLLDVVSGYARWAQVYDAPGNPLIECEGPAVQPILDGFEGNPVLDAACGTGRHLAYLASRGHRVIGTDISPEMLAKARTKVPAADLRVGDLVHLPLEDDEVQALVCALALDHVADLAVVYKEFARVVIRGGSVVVSTMHPVLSSIFGWGAWFVDTNGKVDIPTYSHGIATHVNAAVAAGLSLRECREPAVPTDQLDPASVPLPTRIAYSGMPMILVLHFEASKVDV